MSFIGRYQAGVGAMNGYVYAVGGCDSWNCLSSVEKYDPATNTWSVVSSLNTARRGCGVAVYDGMQKFLSIHLFLNSYTLFSNKKFYKLIILSSTVIIIILIFNI